MPYRGYCWSGKRSTPIYQVNLTEHRSGGLLGMAMRELRMDGAPHGIMLVRSPMHCFTHPTPAPRHTDPTEGRIYGQKQSYYTST